MKLTGRQIAGFLAKPPADLRAALFYGPDRGLVRERAARLTRAVLGGSEDPFRLTDLAGADAVREAGRLADEVRAIAFGGGRRVIRLRDAGDATARPIDEVLAADLPRDCALVVAEAGELGPRSALRRLFEEAKLGAAVACYADDEQTLGELVDGVMAAHRIRLSDEARTYLVANLGGDRLVSRSELEKLALYGGEGAALGLEDVVASVGDSAAVSLDDVAFAVAEGDRQALDRALGRAAADGAEPVRVLRAVARHFQRLDIARTLIDQGRQADQALAALRPPVIFKHAPRMKTQLRRWPTDGIGEALRTLTDIEVACKSAGLPAELLCAEGLARIAARV